jgi:hypothetical protein
LLFVSCSCRASSLTPQGSPARASASSSARPLTKVVFIGEPAGAAVPSARVVEAVMARFDLLSCGRRGKCYG